MRDFYSDRPSGIIGNDDCGQMSAWLVFATLGLYPAQPASGQYVLGVPTVREAALQLADGKRLVVHRSMRGGATLNGRSVERTALRHAEMVQGGVLAIGPTR